MTPSRAGSSPDAVLAGLRGLVEPVVTSAGLDLDELVIRQAGQRNVLRVVIDGEHGVSLDAIAEVSRAVSDVLDAQEGDLGRAPFVLEVTSRGVDRPLTEPRHWRRNTGRLVTVEVHAPADVHAKADGQAKAGARARAAAETLTGRVLSVTDQGVTLDIRRGGGKGRVARSAGERTLGWEQLGTAHVQIEFSRPAGHRDAHLVVEDGELDDGAVDDDGSDEPATADEAGPSEPTHATPTDHRPDPTQDDAGAAAGRPAAGRRRAPRAGRPPRGGRQ